MANDYIYMIRCQSRDQIKDLVRMWMEEGAVYRKTWIHDPEQISRDMGQKQILTLNKATNGQLVISNRSPGWYSDYGWRYSADYQGTYRDFLKHIGCINMPVKVDDYL